MAVAGCDREWMEGGGGAGSVCVGGGGVGGC